MGSPLAEMVLDKILDKLYNKLGALSVEIKFLVMYVDGIFDVLNKTETDITTTINHRNKTERKRTLFRHRDFQRTEKTFYQLVHETDIPTPDE